MADDKLVVIKVESHPVFADGNVEESVSSIVKEEWEFKDCLSKGMEESVFVKCEPAFPSDGEEEFFKFDQNDILPVDKRWNIKEDPHASVADSSTVEVGINVVREPYFDEDGVEEVHNEVSNNSEGSSHDVDKAVKLTGKAVHSCGSCSKTFTLRSSLKSHLLTHTGEKPCHCTICNKMFAHRGTLRNHMLTHSEARLFMCTICGNSFKRLSHLREHEYTHAERRSFSCSICRISFKSLSGLTHHQFTHKDERPFRCSTCGNSFQRLSQLRRHQKIHTDSRPFSCLICGSRFKRLSHLRGHQDTHIDCRFSCSTCGGVFSKKRELKNHIATHNI